MDERIRRHADILVDHSVDVSSGDDVVITLPPVAEELGTSIYERLGEIGANPVTIYCGELLLGTDEAGRAFLRSVDPEALGPPAHMKQLFAESDVGIHVLGWTNREEYRDVPPETIANFWRAYAPVFEASFFAIPEACLTQFPTPAGAQLADMSTDEYRDFAWDAILVDWKVQREYQLPLVEELDSASEVHIVSGGETDIRVSVDGMNAVSEHGEINLPGGEVYTAPVVDSVEGEVLFDEPLRFAGREVRDIYLEFDGGEVVSHGATKNEEFLTTLLDVDAGSRRLGELGVGMNRGIDRFTNNVLFDEKIHGTVHLALGNAYTACVPADRERNQSAIHIDMIVDVRSDSFIEVDGKDVQRDGEFSFDDGG